MPISIARRAASWLVLICILVLFLLYLDWMHPQTYFGLFRDDALYFSSARALARGQGYIIPSFPGVPAQTKYPILFPWLLAWIWRWQPSFPANLVAATHLVELFGCAFLIVTFIFLRRLLGSPAALLGVILCGLQPSFALFSGALMSDLPFAFFALCAVMTADVALRREGRARWALATGALIGLTILTRTQGIGVLAGVVVAGCYRRTFRQAALVSLSAIPFLVLLSGYLHPSAPAGGDALPLPGFQQTLLFYTSYGQFWRFCVPRLAVFFWMLLHNFFVLVRTPGNYALFGLTASGSAAHAVAETVLSFLALLGILRHARANGCKPIHFVSIFLFLLVLVWNYPLADRFFLMFLPLVFAGLWIELGRLISILRKSLRPETPASERAIAIGLGGALIGLAGFAIWNYLENSLAARRMIEAGRNCYASGKREGYDWIRIHTTLESKIVAYEDGALYLFTERQAVPPISFSTEGFFTGNPKVWERDISHLTDAARAVGARFWMVAPDDFWFEAGWPMMKPMVTNRMNELESALPVVFRSHDGRTKIYDLSCLLSPERSECKSFTAFPVPSGDLQKNRGDLFETLYRSGLRGPHTSKRRTGPRTHLVCAALARW